MFWRKSSDRPLPLWFRILRIPLLVYLGLILAMVFFENALLFHPSRYPEGRWPPPGMVVEDAWYNAGSTRLHGWYLACDNPRAVILFSHGNAGNISDRADLLHFLRDNLRCSVLAYDYRGYGRSEGTPTEQGILADGRAARKWLAERAGIAENRIVEMGESLGGGVAVDLAANGGARGLVLENTFSSLPEVAAAHYPWLPVRLLMRAQLNSAKKIGDYHGPLLQSHGDRDQVIPFTLGKKLFDAANEPKEFLIVPGGDHNDPRTPEFVQALDRFIGRLP
jgi:fermentation-respiration switch protein FrsA (DUF1100 family)